MMMEKEHQDDASSVKNEDVVVDKAETENAGFGSYWRIFTYTDRLGWILNITSFVAAAASGAALPLMDLIFGKTVTTFNDFGVNVITPAEFRSQTAHWALYFIYLFVGKFVLSYMWSFTLNMSAIRTTKAMRHDYLKQMLRQEIGFFDKSNSGAIAIQVTTNGNLINLGISDKLGLTVQGLSTFVAAFAVAFAVQWKLTLITIGVVPAILIVTTICISIDIKNEGQILDIYSKAGTIAEEVFSSMRNVHAFWAHPKLSDRYAAYLQDAKRVGLKKSPNYGILFSTEFFCVNAGYGLAFWQGIRMYARGEIEQPGSVITVIFAVLVAATALTQIAPQIMGVTKAASAADGLFKVIDRKSAIDSLSTDGIKPTECSGKIQVRGVEFAYPSRPDAPVLHGLDLDIPAGKATALVGASGCGKSTIIGLLERWYNPNAGRIQLDGNEIEELNLEWLRTNIRLVQQEPVLFNGSVYENVSFGLVGTTHSHSSVDEKQQLVEEACKAAYAHEFIEELPEGYHTQVGERAGRLSGGQKQRIAIARSIISNPKILLLDEATSALDPKAEKIVQAALENVSTGRTTLIIAHKLSTVQKAHNIAVMSNGSIVEQGTHDELLQQGGHYARLVRAQDLNQDEAENDTEKEEVDALHDEDQDLRLKITETKQSRGETITTKQAFKGFDYSLLKCLWIIGKEESRLWPSFLVLAIICIIAGGANPALAVLFARSVGVFQLPPNEMVKRGDFFALMFFIVALVIWGAYFTMGWFTVIVSQNTTYDYRLQMFNDILRQDMKFFDKEENTTGSLVSKLSTSPTSLHELMGFNVALICIGFVNIVASSILAIAVGWKLGLVVVFGALPVIVFFGYLRIRLEFKLEDAVGQRFADSAALASEAVSAIRTVTSLALERTILEQFQDKMANIEKRSIKSFLWTMLWYSLSQSISLLAMALGFWYGSRLLSTGEYSSNQFFTVFIAVIFGGETTAQLFGYTSSITKAQGAANYILWLHSTKPTVKELGDDAPDKDADSGTAATIGCKDLQFTYPLRPKYKVLQGVNVEANSGQSIAFVGASGCGKTTMIALLERFYDPTAGRIIKDGHDISQLCPRRYRSGISLVQQEPTLYHLSVRENVALGLEGEATDEEIIQACKTANIYEFISSLPEGLETLCGSRGIQLSGGQRQRVSIARALIRKPKLLLLDEATSALDTESERIVQAALEKGTKGCTTISVAHRLSTIRNCDHIFVFSRGKIVEQGDHETLLSKKGIYHEMCLGQKLDIQV